MTRQLLMLAGTLCFAAMGCGGDSESTSHVRVIHMAPAAGDVDVAVDGAATAAITALGFQEATDYVALPAGPHDFAVRPTGTSTVALAVADLDLPAGGMHSVVAWGSSTVKGVVVNDSLAGLAAGSIRLNVVHAAEGVGQVDLWAIPTSGAPAPLITDFDEGEQQQLDLPAAAYRVGVDTNNDATPELLFDIPALAASQVVDLFAVKEGANVRLVAVLDGATVVPINPVP